MKKYFNLDKNIIYLNHASVSPWPIQTANAVHQFTDENSSIGSTNYPKWIEVESQLRQKLAKLINAESDEEIALLKSTSEGLSFIAYGIDWHSGDNIVVPDEEFPSNKIVWQSLKDQGVEIRFISIEGAKNPESRLIEAIDENTRLLSCSAVQYASGLRLDLEILGKACKQKQNKVLFCIDSIQAIGAVKFNVQQYQADFVVADGHKWMMGPEGLALFYCKKSLITQMKIHEFGWRMLERPGDFSHADNPYSPTATRFECGSPNMLAIHALNASLDMILEIGIDVIEKLILENTDYLINKLQQINHCEILTHKNINKHAGIVTFRIKNVEAESLYNFLMNNGVMCASRGGGVRFSPHFYNSHSEIDSAVGLVNKFIALEK